MLYALRNDGSVAALAPSSLLYLSNHAQGTLIHTYIHTQPCQPCGFTAGLSPVLPVRTPAMLSSSVGKTPDICLTPGLFLLCDAPKTAQWRLRSSEYVGSRGILAHPFDKFLQ